MTDKNINSAVAYYTAMNNKDLAVMERYLHPTVQFVSPLARLSGKEAVLEAAKGLVQAIKKLNIRAKFATGNQVMLAIDLDCPEPLGNVRTASLLTMENDLITHIEIFLDSRAFEPKKDDIFKDSN